MSEKQQLAVKCCGLQRANEQLVELVTTLETTLESAVDQQEEQQQQQQQSGTLPPLSLPPLLERQGEEEDALGLDADAAAAAEGAACVGDDGCDPMLSHSEGHSPTFTQEGVGVCDRECDGDCGQGAGEPMLTEHEVVEAVQPHTTQPAPTPAVLQAAGPGGADSAPSPPPAAAAAAPAGVAEDTLMAHQKHMRVAEWLAHRVHEGRSSEAPAAGAQSWQKWQEQLPLAEAMSSGSSSTLTIALAEP